MILILLVLTVFFGLAFLLNGQTEMLPGPFEEEKNYSGGVI